MKQHSHQDQALTRRIVAGDEAAFTELFDQYFPRLYRFAAARLNGDHDAACEVVQQTFCKAFEKIDSYRGEAALFTWFSQICRNTLIDYYRANSRRSQTIVLFEDHASVRAILENLAGPASAEPEVLATRAELRRVIQATIDALPDRYGNVLEWKYIDGLTVAEIASHLGVRAKAAESLLTRARAAFREALLDMLGTAEGTYPDVSGR